MLLEYSALILWTLTAITIVLLAPGSIYVIAVSTFGAIIAASLLIAWAAEASESSISRGLALAIVAIVQTIPEYFVEGTIAWKAGKEPAVWLHHVIANFTGANRLLTGFGWPLILLTLIIQRRRNGQQGATTIALRREQSIEVVFMLGASLYYVWVLIEEELTIFDALVWVGFFVAYMWMLARLPRGKEAPEEPLLGPSLAIVEIKSKRKKTGAILGLFLFAGLTFVLITEQFRHIHSEPCADVSGRSVGFWSGLLHNSVDCPGSLRVPRESDRVQLGQTDHLSPTGSPEFHFFLSKRADGISRTDPRGVFR